MVVSNDENVKNMLINLNSQDQNNCLDLWPICLISKPCTFESLDLELARLCVSTTSMMDDQIPRLHLPLRCNNVHLSGRLSTHGCLQCPLYI
jgi:hypothetical protein